MIVDSVAETETFSGKVFHDSHPATYMLMPLYEWISHFGFIVLELTTLELHVYEAIRLQLSSSIYNRTLLRKSTQVQEELKLALDAHKKTNEKLYELVQKALLTNVYNRRGFDVLSQQHLMTVKRTRQDFLIVFADLDKLKEINDKFGHADGDAAISIAAVIFKKVFRESDIIGRIGGDEFVILAACTKIEEYSHICNRIRSTIEEMNKVSGKPYRVSFSTGVCAYDHHPSTTIALMMQKADATLYEEKKKRRTIREEPISLVK